jgi:hypothetical protein
MGLTMKIFACLLMTIPALMAADKPMPNKATKYPEASISNGLIQAKLYMPDADRGHYRATRFDWAGIIHSLTYKGHQYVTEWNPRPYDPKLDDAVTGPAEEFRASVGYAEAAPGGTFVRMGIGSVRKPEEKAYRYAAYYDIVDLGKRTIRKSKDAIVFIHELHDPAGYAYVYTKTVRLVKGKPELRLEHSLRNIGTKVIDTNHYNHNFFTWGGLKTGPDFSIQFPFDATAARPLGGAAEVKNRRFTYLKELTGDDVVQTTFEGLTKTPADYDFKLENRKAGLGVHIRGDQPILRLFFWSVPNIASLEPYLQVKVEPGAEMKWNLNYEFYTLSPETPRGNPR